MNHSRSNSSPNLVRPSTVPTEKQYDDSSLQGVASNVKLLLKLIHDHKSATDEEKNDRRRMLRVATMLTILDNVRERIQKSQSFGKKTSSSPSSSGPELRRCYTDLKPHNLPKDKKPHDEAATASDDDDKEKMRRQLIASLAARKSLQAVCSTLGKEKAIMAGELLKKVHELGETEDLVNDLKEQNQSLRERVQECVSEHSKEKKDTEVIAALQERNRVLSGQLLTSLEQHHLMKKRIKSVEEENALIRVTVDEMGVKVARSLERVRSFNERTGSPESTREEILAMESMFESFQILVEKHKKKQGECNQLKAEISACKPSVVA